MADDLAFTSAVDLARQIRSGERAVSDVIEATLARIEARNDATNAFVHVTADRAREQARSADRALEHGEDIGPLHGVPVAIKDLDHVAGVPTTFGSRMMEGYVPDESSLFVDRLEAAGAIVVGKTNTPEFGFGTTTENLVAGATNTPFHPDRTSGGSSGGAAAAVADGLVPIAQASDTGGSIRIPAAFCGAYGIKPTFGRIPRPSRPDGFSNHSPFSHYGPVARTVEDAALMFQVMAGPAPSDPFSLPDTDDDYVAATGQSVTDLSVAVSPGLGTYPVDADVRDGVETAVDALSGVVDSVEYVDPDLGVAHHEVLDAFYTNATVKWHALFRNLEREHGIDPYGEDREKLGAALRERVLEGPSDVPASDVKEADLVRTQVLDGIEAVFDEYDLLLCATCSVPPFEIGNPPTEVDGVEIEPDRGWVICQPFNFTGHPVGTVPVTVTDQGLPIGLQLVGHRHADETVVAASAALERVNPWADSYPAR